MINQQPAQREMITIGLFGLEQSHIVKMRIGMIVNAAFTLQACAGCRNRPNRHGCGAAQLRAFFQHQDRCALFGSGQRRHQTGAATAHNHHIIESHISLPVSTSQQPAQKAASIRCLPIKPL